MGAQEDIRTPNAYGWTPMHSCHWKGHTSVINWLMEVGAAEDMDAEDNEGHTPAYWAQRAKGN
jgi:ankyrin repeat protein